MKKILSVAMIFLVVLSTFSMFTPQTKSEPDETPLEVAEKAAVYVIGQAIPENGGYKWPQYDPADNHWYDIPHLMAFIGTFLVSLNEKTGNSTYLDYAKGAARWIISEAIPDSGGYKWKYPWHNCPDGWYFTSRVYHIGEFLLRMYQVTGNTTYLDYAKGAAQWMAAMAEYEAGGCFIPVNPPGKYGSQASHGISPGREAETVTFLLHMYQETGNSTYLTYVNGTAEWLISGPDKEYENGGYKWRHDRPYYVKYPIHGNALIALFFYEIYQEVGNETYLEHANNAVQWILSQAVSDDGGYKWPLRQGETTYYLFALPGFHFAGLQGYDKLNTVLLVGYSITSNSTYLEYAKKHVNWVLNQAVSEGDGSKFPEYEKAGSYYYNAFINAMTYSFLSEMYNVVQNASYSDYANGAFAWIVDNATVTDGGYKWKTIDYYPYYPWWFGWGASGIGYYLLTAPSLIVSATIYIDPDTLNLKSNGEWITAYIELPEGYDVADINFNTVLLTHNEFQLSAVTDPQYGFVTDPESYLMDHDEDGIMERMVKFDRAALRDYLGEVDIDEGDKFYDITLTVTGEVAGIPFKGSDTITVKRR